MEFKTKTLSKFLLKRYLKEIIFIDNIQMRRFGKWNKDNFLLDLPLKFKLSSCVFLRGKLGGYCIASKKGKTARIHRIAVAPECTGYGIGHLMIKFLKRKARRRNCNKIIAETLKNIESNKFYQKEGFKRLDSVKQKKYSLRVYVNEKLKLRKKFMDEYCVFELRF